jgi:MFS family permease
MTTINQRKMEKEERTINYAGAVPLIAMMIFMIALSIYGENEAQWFNSYVANISDVSNSENKYFYVSLMVSASGILGAVAFLIWGCVSDSSKSKFGRRKPLLLVGSVSTAILVFSFGLSTNYWWLFVCDGILIAFTSNMFHIANRALIPDIWPIEKRGKVNTFMFIGSTLGTVFVWVISLSLIPQGVEAFSREVHQWMFAAAAIALIIAGFTVWFGVKEPPIPTYIQQVPWTVSLKNLFNINELKKYPEFLKLFGASLIVIMASNAFKPFLLVSLQKINLESPYIVQGIVFVVLMFILAMYLLFKQLDKSGRKPITLICLILAPIGCFIVGFSRGEFIPVILGLGIGFPFIMALEIAVSTWTQDLLPEEERGKFLGIINIGRAAGQAPGALLAGFVADTFVNTLGVFAVFILAAIFLIISVPVFLKVQETVKH